MNALFSNANLAKWEAWIGSLLGAGAAAGLFGKYNALAAALAIILGGHAVHNASNTAKQ